MGGLAVSSGPSAATLTTASDPRRTLDEAIRATMPSMPREIGISFADSAGVHRVRNFAEELSQRLTSDGKLGRLSMDDADAAVAQVRVTHVSGSKLTRSLLLVDELLRSHRLSEEANFGVIGAAGE